MGLHLSYKAGCSFFCKSFVIRLLVFSWLFRWIILNLMIIPVWTWEEVNVISTYSAAIFDPPLYISQNVFSSRNSVSMCAVIKSYVYFLYFTSSFCLSSPIIVFPLNLYYKYSNGCFSLVILGNNSFPYYLHLVEVVFLNSWNLPSSKHSHQPLLSCL